MPRELASHRSSPRHATNPLAFESYIRAKANPYAAWA
jgi:hypothetical protein